MRMICRNHCVIRQLAVAGEIGTSTSCSDCRRDTQHFSEASHARPTINATEHSLSYVAASYRPTTSERDRLAVEEIALRAG
jgi:hypothetical protein